MKISCWKTPNKSTDTCTDKLKQTNFPEKYNKQLVHVITMKAVTSINQSMCKIQGLFKDF